MEKLNATCKLCGRIFFYDKAKRKEPKYCNAQCYLTTLRSTPPEQEKNVTRESLTQKEWARNIALALGILLMVFIIWMVI